MNITLESVRGSLRGPFGKDSFVASFIRTVETSETCPTACITPDGRMQYNPFFADKHLKTGEAVFCLIVHELCHCLFRHSIHGSGILENIGEDALINAFITVAFPEAGDDGVLFRSFYPSDGLEGLLRPGSNMDLSRFGFLYRKLYEGRSAISSGEVIQALRVLVPNLTAMTAVVLLGSHGRIENSPSNTVLENIAEDLGRALDKTMTPGSGGSLVELFKKRIASAVAIKRAVLRRYTTSRRLDNFLAPLREHRIGVSPIPISPSKRELIMLHAGLMPPHFRRPMVRERMQRKGLAVYLDVSGSVQEHLPRILGILARMQDVLTGIFLFSTKVEEIPFKRLLEGKLTTTYGTSFNCVADSIVERGYERAVVLTDGYAFLTGDRREALEGCRARILTILFGGSTECAPLAPFGEVVELDQVVA